MCYPIPTINCPSTSKIVLLILLRLFTFVINVTVNTQGYVVLHPSGTPKVTTFLNSTLDSWTVGEGGEGRVVDVPWCREGRKETSVTSYLSPFSKGRRWFQISITVFVCRYGRSRGHSSPSPSHTRCVTQTFHRLKLFLNSSIPVL